VNESVDDDACKKLIGRSLPRGPGRRGSVHWLSCSRLVVLFFGGTIAAPAPSLVALANGGEEVFDIAQGHQVILEECFFV
jgi:hypothetical protein